MQLAVTGAELHYETDGDGPACLVPTGIGTAPYLRQLAHLSGRLRLIHVDLRASGESTGEADEASFDVLAADLDAVRAAVGAERIAVLGHSIMGLVALEYGRRYPDRVSHVITVGTPPTGDMRVVGARAQAFFDADASAERKQLLAERMAALQPKPSFQQVMAAETPKRFSDARTDVAPLFAGAIMRPALIWHLLGKLAPTWDVVSDPATLSAPHLLCHGRHDYTVPHTLWDGVWDKLPRAAWRLFERSGHQPFCEEPERFTRVVTEWMAV